MRIPRVAAVALLALALVGCTPDDPTATPSGTATPAVTVTPQPEETTEAPVEPVGLSADDYDNLKASIESGNTAALEGYLSSPVNFIIAASECCGPLTPLEAISGLDYLSGATGPWAIATESLVAEYRTGSYGEYFPEGAFGLLSNDTDPYVVSFSTEGKQVTGLFIAGGESVLYL